MSTAEKVGALVAVILLAFLSAFVGGYLVPETGAQGPQGEQGEQGLAGANGERGLLGPTGEQGVTGERGPVGVAGPQGVRGATGPTGAPGAAGAPGATGPTGAAGPQGPPGIVGVIETRTRVAFDISEPGMGAVPVVLAQFDDVASGDWHVSIELVGMASSSSAFCRWTDDNPFFPSEHWEVTGVFGGDDELAHFVDEVDTDGETRMVSCQSSSGIAAFVVQEVYVVMHRIDNTL